MGSDLIAVRLQTLSMRFGGILVFGGRPGHWMEWEGWFGADFSYLEPRTRDPAVVVPASATWESVFTFGHRFGTCWRLGAHQVLTLSARFDVAFPPGRFVVPTDGIQPPVVVFQGSWVQWGLQAGLRW